MEHQTVEEMFESFWFAYPSDLCRGKRGGKKPAEKAWKKVMPKADSDEFYRIMENMKAQTRADRKDKDSYRWPFISSYLNQSRFDDVIASESVRIQKEESKICAIEGCNEPCHGSKFTKCARHVTDSGDMLKTAWKETGLDIKSPTFQQDCLQYARSMGFRIGG